MQWFTKLIRLGLSSTLATTSSLGTLGLQDHISFHGATVVSLRAAFKAAIDHYLADCAAAGRAPEKAASGKLMLRVPPDVHSAAAIRAKTEGKSLNQWAAEVIAQAAQH